METGKSGTGNASLFNRVSMGYAVIESDKAPDWSVLLGQALGMDVRTCSDGGIGARMDDHERRILIAPGHAEDLVALGLELADDDALKTVLARLAGRGVAVHEGSPHSAARRGVARFWSFDGPKGLQIELYRQPLLADESPRLGCSGFVTGNQGFGHVAITTRQPDSMSAFWREIFDIRHSDDVQCRISGVPLQFEFLRFNARHHSIALAYTPRIRLDPIRTRIQHLEVQVAALDDLSAAYKRCRQLGLHISMAVGQHANDKAISFYVQTPSGFDLEFGWNPLSVEESTWTPELWDSISNWGHRPEDQTMGQRIGQLARGVASLFREEYRPAGF